MFEKGNKLALGNTTWIGKKHTPETRKKMSDAKKGKDPWNKGKKGVQKWTEKQRHVISKKLKGRIFSEEHRKNISIAGRGKKKTKEHIEKISSSKIINNRKKRELEGRINEEKIQYPQEWKETLKRSIRERDNYICQMPGCNKMQGDIAHHIHHIDYNKKNCNPENLITLCNSCHGKTNHNREYWKEYLKKGII